MGWGYGTHDKMERVGCEHGFATRGSPKRKEGVLSADFGVTYVFRMASQYFSTSISAPFTWNYLSPFWGSHGVPKGSNRAWTTNSNFSTSTTAPFTWKYPLPFPGFVWCLLVSIETELRPDWSNSNFPTSITAFHKEVPSPSTLPRLRHFSDVPVKKKNRYTWFAVDCVVGTDLMEKKNARTFTKWRLAHNIFRISPVFSQ